MSSLRNSIPSRSYRERPQPLSRASKHPLLEKARDYKLRARDHKTKQLRLKQLRERATNRNPDEFAFGMMREGARAGAGKSRGAANSAGVLADEEEGGAGVAVSGGMSQTTARLLKGQDAGFLRVMHARIRKERERLEKALQISANDLKVMGEMKSPDGNEDDVDFDLGDDNSMVDSRHTVFVEDQDAQQLFNPATHFDTDEMSLGRAYNRPRLSQNGRRDVARTDVEALTPKQQNQKHTQRAQLALLRKQETELAIAERELEIQRARMAGDIGGIGKKGVRWKAKGRKR